MKSKSEAVKIGDKFGRWTVIGKRFPQTKPIDGFDEWLVPCRCACGLARPVRVLQLINGHSKSCGCYKKDVQRARHLVHGEASVKTRTKLYRVWWAMRQRCENVKREGYKAYGGRGISVCKEWSESFVAFRDWANANGYSPELQLDRTDNDKGYSPDNCRWVTEHDNHRNMRQTVMVTAFGETKCITDWSRDSRCVVDLSTIRHRMNKLGLSAEEAITKPSREKNKKRRRT